MIVEYEDIRGKVKYRVSRWDARNNPYLLLWARTCNGMNVGIPRNESILPNFADQFVNMYKARSEGIREYGFAIPDFRALRAIQKHSPNGVIEIGAGSGYWAMLLSKLGVKVEAYDSATGKYRGGFEVGKYPTVHQLDHKQALSKEHDKMTLFMCWPDYNVEWPTEALKLYRGNTFAYIGEGSYGCTGGESLHELLAAEWHVACERRIPQWSGINDYLTIYERGKDNG